MPKFSIRVSQTKYPDYPLYHFYDIDAANYHDGEKLARQKFVQEWGFGYEYTTAYTFDKYRVTEELKKGFVPSD
jgi:hypothetical protein